MIAVLAVVLVVAGVGGFLMLESRPAGPTTALDRAQVTGYATSNVSGQTTGAVSVELNGESAARIDQIVEGLPAANLAYVCSRNAQEYHISFSTDVGRGRQGFGLTGYGCNNLVVEVPAHGATVDRIDRYCALIAAVRRLLPARAMATHAGTCSHASGRLFLAVVRHATHPRKAPAREAPIRQAPTHKTAAHKAPAHKAPAGKSPKHKAPAHKVPKHKWPRRRWSGHETPRHMTPRREAMRRGSPARVMSRTS